MKKIIFILFAVLPLVLFAQNDREAERRVKAVVSELKQSTYEGRFTLLYYNAQSETTDKQSGDLTIKGNKFRMTLGSNETKFDGKTQWVFISEYNEVSVTEPTKEELRFLYEIDSNIIGFGYEKDPRIHIILEDRNIKAVLTHYKSLIDIKTAEAFEKDSETVINNLDEIYNNLSGILSKINNE